MIRSLIFDIGNVLLRFDHARGFRQLESQSGIPAELMQDLFFSQGLGEHYERGELSTAELHQMIESESGMKYPIEGMCEQISDIFSPIEPMHALVAEMKAQGFRLVILSNTCDAHWSYAKRRYEVFSHFDGAVLSHEVGAIKPEPKIYEQAIQLAQCRASECFYVDDIPEFAEAARELGMKACVYSDEPAYRRALAEAQSQI